MNPEQLKQWQEELADLSPDRILSWAAETFPGTVTLASSLGAEDQVLTHLVAGLAEQRLDDQASPGPIPIFMLDTGRIFQETYDLLEKTRETYHLPIQLYFPDSVEVEEMVDRHGPNLFMESVALRKHCCQVRKVHPLRRALEGRQAWITGLRREQSPTRDAVQPVEWDAGNRLYKINPLYNWSETRVWDFIREHAIPYNVLHDRGFPSIGCSSCTRAVKPGEDSRAGRWWWESPEQKECGLHIVDGKVIPAREPIPV